MGYLSIKDIDCEGQQLIIRADLNVSIQDNTIIDDTRIIASLPTIEWALNHGASVVLLSHLGQPKQIQSATAHGVEFDPAYSLAPVAKRLSTLLKRPVNLYQDIDSRPNLKPGEIVLCENTRFHTGEKKNDPTLAKQFAALGDIFVMDAYGAVHREHASTVGVAQYALKSCIGLLMQKELEGIGRVLESPEQPVVAIVGGAKVSSKITLLRTLIPKVNTLIVGGGIANTFLAAQGIDVHQSLYEADCIPEAKALMALAEAHNTALPLPIDAATSNISPFGKTQSPLIAKLYDVKKIPKDSAIYDVGPKTSRLYDTWIKSAKTILWNGPIGVVETPAFSLGTQGIIQSIGESKGYSLAGGGETLMAIALFKAKKIFSQVSTGGGAMLSTLENPHQPGLKYIPQQ